MLNLSRGQFFGPASRTIVLPNMTVTLRRADVPADAVAEHCHADEAHFVLAIDAGYRSSAAGAPDTAGGPMLVYNPPGTVHRDRFAATGAYYLALTLDRDWLAELDLVLPRDAVALSDIAPKRHARRLLGRCVGAKDAFAVEEACLSLLAASAMPDRAPTPSKAIAGAIALMHDTAAPLSVQRIAQACGLHPVYLARAFRRATGQSPAQYRDALRLDRAASRLRHSRISLCAVAQDCGYSDQSHMSRAFRSAFGVTPSAYRAAFA